MRSPPWLHPLTLLLVSGCFGGAGRECFSQEAPLAGTTALDWQGDIAARMVAGVDRYLLDALEQSVDKRQSHWHRDTTSTAATYSMSVAPNRKRLRAILGVRDERDPIQDLELVATTKAPAHIFSDEHFDVFAVRWRVFGNVHGEGLWLVPKQTASARVIALPDADQSPELICGLEPGLPPESQYARQLAANGCEVLVPTLISRHYAARNGRAKMTDREYLYRSAFELGRHLIGYELQKILAAVDWYAGRDTSLPLGVAGYGEGGMLAFYAAAIDPRLQAACISGYFEDRQPIWRQPISRNVFGLLEQFGDAEIASLIVPRQLTIHSGVGPSLTLPSEGGAPATLQATSVERAEAEIARLRHLVEPWPASVTHLADADVNPEPNNASGTASVALAATRAFWSQVTGRTPEQFVPQATANKQPPAEDPPRSSSRYQRQFAEIERHNQWLLNRSASERRRFLNLGSHLPDQTPGRFPLNTDSLETYERSLQACRDFFHEEVIGRIDEEPQAFNPRSRLVVDEPGWLGYEVVLDVFPNVFAYGMLCLPKNLQPGERRPVIVCQHGLEGRPRDTLDKTHRAYQGFAAQLVERGYVVFAPQNLYIGQDRFRTLQRKANPLGQTLFSVMVAQHQQLVDWLQSQPFADPDRIAFYGLSYGGKTAMRVPAIVTDYCLSICSGDFNDWVDKNATTQADYSYVWTGEYEIFEFGLGSTFNYAEMAALIAPRPFMVERGHLDAVGIDERVAAEFARVRYLYALRLGIPERCEIEWFVGPHQIHGRGTFAFLDRHLTSGDEAWLRKPDPLLR